MLAHPLSPQQPWETYRASVFTQILFSEEHLTFREMTELGYSHRMFVFRPERA